MKTKFTNKLVPNPGQIPFLKDFSSVSALSAGFGSGKSWAGGLKFILCTLINGYKDGIRTYAEGLIVGPNFKITAGMAKTIFDLFRIMDIKWEYKRRDAEIWIVNKIGTRKRPAIIHLRSGAAHEDIVQLTVATCWLDEAALMQRDDYYVEKDVIKQSMTRVRAVNCNKPFTILTSTPNNGTMSRFYDICLGDPDDKDRKLFFASTLDNINNLHPNYIKELNKLYPDEKSRRAYLEGEFINFGGSRTYPCFDEYSIRPVEYDPNLPLDLACDFGNPNHFVLCQELANGNLVALNEMGHKNVHTQEAMPLLSNLIADMGGTQHIRIFGDATGGGGSGITSDTHYTVMQNHFQTLGIKAIEHTPLSNPRVSERVATVNSLLKDVSGKRHLHISPKCVGLIRDFREVIFKDDGKSIHKTKELSHFSDALGYWCYILKPPTLIEEIPDDLDLRWNI